MEDKGKGKEEKKTYRTALPHRSYFELPKQQYWVPGPRLRSSNTVAHMGIVREYLTNMFTPRDLSFITESRMSVVEHHEAMARSLLQVVPQCDCAFFFFFVYHILMACFAGSFALEGVTNPG